MRLLKYTSLGCRWPFSGQIESYKNWGNPYAGGWWEPVGYCWYEAFA